MHVTAGGMMSYAHEAVYREIGLNYVGRIRRASPAACHRAAKFNLAINPKTKALGCGLVTLLVAANEVIEKARVLLLLLTAVAACQPRRA
jgi:hypothetical protein